MYYNYIIPLSRNFNCQFHAERIVSSIDVVAFQPRTSLAFFGSAHTFSISPLRRPTILCGTLTPVARSNELISSRTDNPTPVEFYYFLELDIDPTQAVTISFLKRGLLQTGFNFTLPPQESNQRPYIVKFPNVITIPPIGYTLNLFEAHIHSDTIVFNYTAQNGTKKEFRFSLAGFNEKYLEQFA